MVFSSPTFLFLFLPAVLAGNFAVPRRFRNGLLVATSIVFYLWGAGAFVAPMILTTAADFVLALGIETARTGGRERLATLLLIGSLLQNLCLLVYYKYAGFLGTQINSISHVFGSGGVSWGGVLLPIGISFFTFERISYTADVRKGIVKACRSPIDFLLFTALFPRAIAGPIVRFREIAEQLSCRASDARNIAQGLTRFAHGLVKKVIVADAVATVADAAFAQTHPSATTAWGGVVAYTIQIYFDFSGYSDMAIGLAQVLGFRLPENFNRPYSAVSITDFWRRWHMTLSRWFRDYVYIPLGGSRRSRARTYLNLVATFLLVGLWHGASWTFVIWGLYHGFFLMLERLTGLRSFEANGLVGFVRRFATLFIVMIGWVLFRAHSAGQATGFVHAMFFSTDGTLAPEVSRALSPQTSITLLAAAIVFLLPAGLTGARLIAAGAAPAARVYRCALLAVAFPWSLVLAASGTFSPFLYFRF